MQLFLWPDLTFFRQRKSVMRKVHLLKKRISLNCNCKTKDKDQKSGEPGRITPNKSVSLAWLYIQVFRLLIIPKLFQLYIMSPESDFISPGFPARKSTFYRGRKKKVFSHFCSIVISPPFPLSSPLSQKKHRLSIQKAFSPFLSWPVNLFINCSGL